MGAEISSIDKGLKCDCCSNLSSNKEQGKSKTGYRFPTTRPSVSSINQGVLLDNLLTLSEHGQPQALQSFLDARKDAVNVNMQNEEGDTALHLAARKGKINNCKILLQRGAVLLKNNEGKTALDIAIESNHIYCAGALRSVEGKQLQEQDSANATVKHALEYFSPPLEVTGLYDYEASDSLPFPPDHRMELHIHKGEKFDVIFIRPDGWCLASRPGMKYQGYIPGNFVTSNGSEPLVQIRN